MKNYFVFVNYYLSNGNTPIDCDSMLMTNYKDCLSAWENATQTFSKCIRDKGYSKFTITEFKEVE